MQFEYSLSAKWLELLKQIAPSVTRAAVLRDPAVTAGIGQFAVIQSAAPSLGIDVSQALAEALHIELANVASPVGGFGLLQLAEIGFRQQSKPPPSRPG